jgi:hypothetical protein
MENKFSLPYSQKCATIPSAEPDEFSTHSSNLKFLHSFKY